MQQKSTKIVELKINLDKKIYRIGDTINVKYILINKSNTKITLTIPMDLYEINIISMYDLKNNKLEPIRKFDLAIKPRNEKDSFLILEPKNSLCYIYKGVIRKDRLYLIDSFEDKEGYFLDFKTSAIQIPEIPGDYKIKIRYSSSDYLKESGYNEFGFTNIWSGEIESKEVRIKIIK